MSTKSEAASPNDLSASTGNCDAAASTGEFCGVAASAGQLARFCIPLLAMGIGTPVLSLVDTAVVGRQSALGLASLAPATALCDLLTYIFYALGATTTNFVASALCRPGGLAEERRVVRTGLFIANAFGGALAILLLCGGDPLLKLLAGSDAMRLLGGASAYTSVRALGMPAALSLFVLQAASLGAKEWRPPLVACAVACVFNLIADVVLVCNLRLGVVGAALGTVAAQYAAVATLMVLRVRRLKQLAALEADANTGDANGANAFGMVVPMAGVQTRRLSRLAAIATKSLPSRAELSAWARFGMPLGLGQVARVANVALVTATASAGGAIACAAHQVCVSLFWALAPFGDAVSLTAKAFLQSLADSSEASTVVSTHTLRTYGRSEDPSPRCMRALEAGTHTPSHTTRFRAHVCAARVAASTADSTRCRDWRIGLRALHATALVRDAVHGRSGHVLPNARCRTSSLDDWAFLFHGLHV